MGKRVDYSGRSVIVVDPSLDVSMRLSQEMALELFKPFVMKRWLIKRFPPTLKMT
jgi:DNA-directed RNA polymerase subunit beta'